MDTVATFAFNSLAQMVGRNAYHSNLAKTSLGQHGLEESSG
jgi:hypothetical protein